VRRLAAIGPDLLKPHVAEVRDSALRRAVISSLRLISRRRIGSGRTPLPALLLSFRSLAPARGPEPLQLNQDQAAKTQQCAKPVGHTSDSAIRFGD
jgi:hypothetical protein